MRNLWVGLLICSFLLAGCTSNSDDDGTDGDGTSSTIVKGTSLGEWTESLTGGPLVGSETVNPDQSFSCSAVPTSVGSHPFTLPAKNADGVAWQAKPFTITLVKDNAASVELDIHLFNSEGTEIAANTESDLDSETAGTLTIASLAPAEYTVEVHACSPTSGYSLELVGKMVSTVDVAAA